MSDVDLELLYAALGEPLGQPRGELEDRPRVGGHIAKLSQLDRIHDAAAYRKMPWPEIAVTWIRSTSRTALPAAANRP